MSEILNLQQNYTYTFLERKPMMESKKLLRVYVEIQSPAGKKEKLHLISKFPNCAASNKSQSGQYTENVLGLSKAFIPVVPFVYIVSDSEVLIPDLTWDGGVILDKHAVNLSPRNVTRQTGKLIREFDMAKALLKLAEIVTNADMYGIKLPFDDPLSLYITPDLNIKHLVLDVDRTDLNNPDPVANAIAYRTISQMLQYKQKEFSR